MIASPLPVVAESLGWTLLHFVWQGAVGAAVLFGLLAATRRASAQALRPGLRCLARGVGCIRRDVGLANRNQSTPCH